MKYSVEDKGFKNYFRLLMKAYILVCHSDVRLAGKAVHCLSAVIEQSRTQD